MIRLRRVLVLAMVLLIGGVSLTGCQSKEPSAVEMATEGKEVSTKVAEALTTMQPQVETHIAGNINLLTGEGNLAPEAMGKRPVAVMINNAPKSLPQYGVEAADVIFEIPVEGGSTRFMAMYGDYTQVPEICSIRSCRPYFPALSEGFDAIYVNWGMMDEVRAYVNTLGLTHFEGLYNTGGLFRRDQERKDAGYATEHTGVFDGTRVDDVLNENNQRTDIEADKTDTAFHFAPVNASITPEDGACTKVEVNFGAVKATLTYDVQSGKYLKNYNDEPQIDGRTGNQLSFTNVLVLETDIHLAENGIHREVDWHGGRGYYITNGAMQKITWKKSSESSRLVIYDEDGNELVLNRGKSYIAVNNYGRASFE